MGKLPLLLLEELLLDDELEEELDEELDELELLLLDELELLELEEELDELELDEELELEELLLDDELLEELPLLPPLSPPPQAVINRHETRVAQSVVRRVRGIICSNR